MATPPTESSERNERAPGLGGAFHRLWAAGIATNLGDGMLATALPLIAASLTQDPLVVSGLMAARFLPWLLVGPFSGVLLDRVDRLRAMVVSNTIAALTVTLLAVVVATGRTEMWVLYVALFVVICCETVTDPATRITVSRVVSGTQLDRANSRLEGGRLVAQDFLAKPVAGVLFAVVAVLPVAATALSYALCAVLVAMVVALLRRNPGRYPAEEPSQADGNAWRSLGEGIGYVLRDSLMRNLMFNNACTMIGMQMATAVMVLYVQQVLGVAPALYGVFMSAVAVGGLLGTLLVPRLMLVVGRRFLMLGGYSGMGLCLLLFGAFPHLAVAVIAWGLLGVCMVVSNVAGSIFFQTVVPDRIRGRAAAVFRTLGWGAAPLGALLGGFLGRIDLSLPYLVGGVVMIGAVIVFRRAVVECARLCDLSTGARTSH